MQSLLYEAKAFKTTFDGHKSRLKSITQKVPGTYIGTYTSEACTYYVGILFQLSAVYTLVGPHIKV